MLQCVSTNWASLPGQQLKHILWPHLARFVGTVLCLTVTLTESQQGLNRTHSSCSSQPNSKPLEQYFQWKHFESWFAEDCHSRLSSCDVTQATNQLHFLPRERWRERGSERGREREREREGDEERGEREKRGSAKNKIVPSDSGTPRWNGFNGLIRVMVFIIEQLSLWLTWVWCCFESFALVLLKKKVSSLGGSGRSGRRAAAGRRWAEWVAVPEERKKRGITTTKVETIRPFFSVSELRHSNQIKSKQTPILQFIHLTERERECEWVSLVCGCVSACVCVDKRGNGKKEEEKERERAWGRKDACDVELSYDEIVFLSWHHLDFRSRQTWAFSAVSYCIARCAG